VRRHDDHHPVRLPAQGPVAAGRGRRLPPAGRGQGGHRLRLPPDRLRIRPSAC
jgi:hypothetical protein